MCLSNAAFIEYYICTAVFVRLTYYAGDIWPNLRWFFPSRYKVFFLLRKEFLDCKHNIEGMYMFIRL